MEATSNAHHSPPSWLDLPLSKTLSLNGEKVLFILILIVAVITRFYDLGTRVMSHDETSHVYFSWLYAKGNGYTHDPVTHGPFQFHAIALSYFLFGDNDFTARIPVALFSIATVYFIWHYRRFLGRIGALIAAILLVISPYMLYYGRYARNEAFVALWGVMMLWAILRYLESGENRYLYWLTAATALHFTTKETSFIYTAQALIFLAIYLVYRLTQQPWANLQLRRYFQIALLTGLLLFGLTGVLLQTGSVGAPLSPTETAPPRVPGQGLEPLGTTSPHFLPMVIAGLGLIALALAAFFAIRGYTWPRLRAERSFAMLILLGTLVLPMLAPFPVKFLGYNPIDYKNPQIIALDATSVIILSLIAIATGLVWNTRLWVTNAILFYGIFTVLYTSIFTNGFGFVTGLVGSLGYWLEQQGVNRGSQPWYYYALIQIPIYEFLPALGTIAAFVLALTRRRIGAEESSLVVDQGQAAMADSLIDQAKETLPANSSQLVSPKSHEAPPTVGLLCFWSLTSLIAYTIAGEKMPWLTVHIALPMILTAAWFLGQLVEAINWDEFRRWRGWVVILVLIVFITSALSALGSLLGPNPPFQGKELGQLQATSTFITAALTAVVSAWGLGRLAKPWTSEQFYRVITLVIFGLLGILTIRTAFRAAYINYDNATEYLVYAHMSRGPKEALEQIEEISRRTTNGLALRVAYDNETTYPFWWYLRNFTNKDYFDKTPTRAQREAVAILVGEANYGKIEPIVGQAYYRFEYTRIWWPDQDYFGLTWQRILDALLEPQMRAAIFNIWLNRDYTLYSQLVNKDMSLENWQPSLKFRLYLRKDVVASLWNYGVSPSTEAIVADPYEGKQIKLVADRVLGGPGTEPGQFMRPRNLAVAPDGSIYIADTENHRIQHLTPEGTVLHVWGVFGASTETAPAPSGTFNEPWGIAVGPDGSIYVADTWNHRIQKFTSEGQFIKTWGYGISQTEDPYGFYGPRGLAVDMQGRVYVTDTGNKRVIVFDSEGNYITKFGGAGFEPGHFDEPVGIAVDNQGQVFVVDTWNQRIQVFIQDSSGNFMPLTSWDIVGWYGQSLDNKPYLAVDQSGHVYVTDPEGYRILEFTSQGQFVRYWGDYSTGPDGFNLPTGLAIDAQGGVWVADTNNGRILHFTLPAP